jgi:hypothetical protein
MTHLGGIREKNLNINIYTEIINQQNFLVLFCSKNYGI